MGNRKMNLIKLKMIAVILFSQISLHSCTGDYSDDYPETQNTVSHYSIVNYEGRQLLCQNKKDAPEYIKYDKQITLDTKDYGVTLLCSYATIKAYEPTTTTTTTTTRRPGYCQQGQN